MSIPRPGSTVKLKPVPVVTSTARTPSAFPSVRTEPRAPASCWGSPMRAVSSGRVHFLPEYNAIPSSCRRISRGRE